MPIIPVLNEQVRKTAAGPRGDILAQEKLAIGGAIQAVTGAGAKFLNQLQESQDKSDLSSALAFSAQSRSENVGVIKGDVAGFKDAGKLYDEHEKKVAAQVLEQWPGVAASWAKQDARHADSARVQVNTWQIKRQIDKQKADLVDVEAVWKDEAVNAQDDVALGVASANYFEALDNAVASGAVTEFDAAKRKDKFAVTVTSARIDKDIDANPEVALSKLERGGYAIGADKKLSKETLARRTISTRRKDAETQQKTDKKKADAEIKQQNDELSSDLSIAVSRGEAGLEDIDKAYRAEILTPAKRTQLTKEYDSYHKKTRALSSLVEIVSNARQNGTTLDPKAKESRDAVDQYYKVVSPTWGEENIVDQTISLIKDVRVIPESVKSGIRTWARSGDDTQAVSAAQLVDKIRSAAPETLQDLTSTDKAFADQVNQNIANGMDAKRAVSFARENVFVKSTTPEQRKLVNEQTRGFADKIKSFISGKMDDVFDPFFTIEPDVPLRMQADFNMLLDDYALKSGGDIDIAMSSAWADTVQVWGRSTLNGSAEMIKYAPELIYFGERGDVPQLNEQYKQDLSGIGMTPENTIIGSDSVTASEYLAGKSPTYPLFSDGGLTPALGPDNMPLRWQPRAN